MKTNVHHLCLRGLSSGLLCNYHYLEPTDEVRQHSLLIPLHPVTYCILNQKMFEDSTHNTLLVQKKSQKTPDE